MNYHEVMDTYNHPPSVKYIPRIFGWLRVFVFLFGVHSTAYAMDNEPVIWVQVPQWTDDWAVCAVDIPDAACHWYLQKQTIHLVKDSIGKTHLGSMQMV